MANLMVESLSETYVPSGTNFDQTYHNSYQLEIDMVRRNDWLVFSNLIFP